MSEYTNRLDDKIVIAKDEDGPGIWVTTLDRTCRPQGNAKRLSREEAEALYNRLGALLGL